MNTNYTMTDKEYIEDILLTSKTLVNMYNHATQESSTDKLHCSFKKNMDESFDMQHRIFAAMQQNGWYPQQQAEQTQVNQVRSKYMQ